ncbi:MAG: metallophosphoesterase family protein [Syntrophothermus sp.]
MSIKILHTADIHIGLKFTGRDYPSGLTEKLVADRHDTLERIVELANSNACDLIVIAGDMFDRITVSKADVRQAAEILNRFTGTAVAVLPGNHDFIEDNQNNIWKSFREKMNEHLLIFLEKPRVYSTNIGEVPINFYPGPCTTKHSKTNMISWIKEAGKNSSAISIGVAHGSVEGLSPDIGKGYYPMQTEELRNCGTDLFLLGHTHVRFPQDNGHFSPAFFMPSTPCPDGFDCSHEGYVWIITIDDNKKLSYESVKTGKYLFLSRELNIGSADDLVKIENEILAFPGDTTLLKLKLNGRISKSDYPFLEGLKNVISRQLAYAEFDFDGVTLNIDREYIDANFSRDSLPYRLLSRLAAADDQLALQLAAGLIGESKE